MRTWFRRALLSVTTFCVTTALYGQTPNQSKELADHASLLKLNQTISGVADKGIILTPALRDQLAARRDLIRKVLRDEPANAPAYSLTPATQSALLKADPSLASFMEQDTTLTGELAATVADDFASGAVTTRYLLHTYTADIDLSFAKEIPALAGMLHHPVTIHGLGLPDILAASSVTLASPEALEKCAPTVAQAAAAAAQPASVPSTCSTTGNQGVAVIMVTFPGNSPAFPTGLDKAAYWNSALFGGNPSVNNFWNEVSYGKTTASGNTFGPFALSQSYGCTTTTQLQTAAIAAAAGTVDFSQYNRIVIAFPASTCSFGGLGDLGCVGATSTINHQYSVVWIPVMPTYSTSFPQMWGGTAHELGHNLGLNHASTLDFGTQSLGPLDFTANVTGTVTAPTAGDPTAAAPISGTSIEYGDYFAVMGYPWTNGGPYSAEHRENLLGWIPASDHVDVISAGNFTLAPAENSSGTRALRVLRDPGTAAWVWLEFHQPTGFYTPNNVAGVPGTLTSGALLHYEWSGGDSGHTYLLDMTPTASPNNFNDGTLAPGKSWSDPYSPLTISVGTQSSSALPVTISYDKSCATLALSPSVLPAAGGQATLTVTAPAGCSWTVSSNASWITFPGGVTGSGNGSVTFNASANTSTAQRNSYITAQRQSMPLIQAGSGITVTSLTPSTGTSAVGAEQTFALNYMDAAGISDITNGLFVFSGSPSCFAYVSFTGSTANLSLYDASTGTYSSTLSITSTGGSGTTSSPSCSLVGSGSKYTVSGNSATLSLDFKFTAAFTGVHSITSSFTGKTSSVASLPLGVWSVIAGGLSPQIAITPTSGTLGITQFTKTGTGFTPNSTVAQNITYPDGIVNKYTTTADASGNYSLANLVYSSQTGTYTETDVDTSGASSNTITWSVAATNTPAITFSVSDHTYGDAPFTVSATSNSTGAMTYSVVSGPASISGSTVTLTGAGTVVLQVNQAASGTYAAGSQNATFTVRPASQTITFPAPASPLTYGAAPVTLSATASSSLPVTFSIVSGPGSLSGSTLTITGAGTVVIAADQPGNASYSAAAQVTQSIVVNKASASANLQSSAAAIFVQNSITLTATVTSSAGTPAGTVTFADGGNTLGTGTLANGTAVLTTSSLAAGSHAITASYGGDTNHGTVTTAQLTETVVDLSLNTGNSLSLKLSPGGTGTLTFPVAPVSGTTLPAAVTLSVSGVPAGFTANVSPSSLTAGSASTNVTLTVQVPQSASLREDSGRPWKLSPVLLAILVLPVFRRRLRSVRRLGVLALAILSISVACTLAGCGGSNNIGGGGISPPPQARSYTVLVNASSGALTRSSTVAITVQ